MAPGSKTGAVVNSALSRLQTEYLELLHSNPPFSLLGLFNSPDFHFDEYCKDFAPHPDIGVVGERTIEFGRRYHILLPQAEHYVTCAMFLFPTAPIEKIHRMSKNYAVDFYLNDTMGREAQPTNEEKKLLYEIRDRLSALGDDLRPDGAVSMAEKASIEVLSEIKSETPDSWFRSYLKAYLHHIHVAHKPYDSVSLGRIQSIDEYIDLRCHISGMPHTVAFIEYAKDIYLDWELLEKAGIAADLHRLNWTVSLVGALTNDLFSFEKEVFDNHTDANLVVVLVLNNFRMRLKEAISVAGSIVSNLLSEYVCGLAEVRKKAEISDLLTREKREHLEGYLDGLKAVLQACWMWQTHTRRYKRNRSIWQEMMVRSVPIT